MKKNISPVRLHDLGPEVTTYLDVPKKVVSNFQKSFIAADQQINTKQNPNFLKVF